MRWVGYVAGVGNINANKILFRKTESKISLGRVNRWD
jgi:hypothetical protein